MSWELQLSAIDHDLVIRDGTFRLVNGAQEVAQRVKVSLLHWRGEYFLNRLNGVPWKSILGSKMSDSSLSNILRQKILLVPGVLRIVEFSLSKVNRSYSVDVSIYVQKGPGDTSGEMITLQNISIG
jgi:hypothetical protein